MSFEDEFRDALTAAKWPKFAPAAFSIVRFRDTDNRSPEELQDVAFGIAASHAAGAAGSATVNLNGDKTTLTCIFSQANQLLANQRSPVA